MADRYRRHRQPLAELPNTANTPPTARLRQSQKIQVSSEPAAPLPHNVSLEANGSLVPRSIPTSPEDQRLSRLIVEDDSSKRNSAISTTSTTSGRKRKAYIGHWQLGKTIGKGGCSHVRAVRHRYTQQHGAVKIIARSTAESTRAQSLANLIESTKGVPHAPGYKPIPFGLEREIALMKLLEHRNIVKLYDVWENRNELYLIMEYVDGGELFHFVEQRRGLHEIEAIVIFRQIIAALLYCHRLHICHRDLKPENILLNRQTLEVKLIDFGMAALQPEGRKLSTPCGSPHYAAPEVVSSRPYDGKGADAWSCGVILYVMLTGTTPYNYSKDGELRQLFSDIMRAKYIMPQGLSPEAKDLIRRIFMPDAKLRITLDEIWDHPLLHKYDKELGYVGEMGSKEVAIGPVPKLEDWTIKRPQDVDREILRNMRTLWHSEPESALVSKLLNKDVNQEKIFYAALVKHREENLENYIGEYDSMGYSASDYHHTQPPPAAPRSQSQYSILNNEHLRPSQIFTEATPSLSSYDPYRSSKDPIVPRSELRTTVMRRNESSSTARGNARHNESLRIGMLKHNNRGLYHSSSSLARSRASLHRSSVSKHSLSTTNWPSSPPVIATMRPSDLHKKGVSFNHLRRSSTQRSLVSTTSTKTTPVTPRSRQTSNTIRVPDSSSPEVELDQIIRSRKAQLVQTPRLRTRKASDTPSQTIRSEIRKHSMELEKACEKAFFKSSISSGSPSAQVDTPPSSISARTPENNGKPRPLPSLPDDTPTSFLTRTLKEFRAKLASYKPPEDTDASNFGEVLKLIDDLVPEQQRVGRRFISAPEPRVPDHLGLPIISEESNSDVQSTRYRSVTAPVKPTDTVRLVPPSPAALKRKQQNENNRLSALPPMQPRHYASTVMLQNIDENDVLAVPAAKKESKWLGIARKFTGTSQNVPVQPVRASYVEPEVTEDLSVSAPSSEFPMRRKKPAKRGLGKWLGMKSNAEDTTATLVSRSMDSLFSSSSPSPNGAPPTSAGDTRSWFARFLHIKPAQKLVCFSIPRSRARQELMLIFKEWQRHGIRDLYYARDTQTITARVDRQNSLDIKPVSFRVEIFVVLEHGKCVGLSLARFTQVKGAASGFRKVLEVVHGVMQSRGWLVEDEEKWKAMCEIIEG